MDLTEARTVLWPFAKPKMPIGELFDQGVIDETDLQRAIGAAYSRRLKSACTAVLEVIARQKRKPISATAAHPAVCPICGAAVQPEHRWDSRRGPGWRCASGLEHFLTINVLPIVQAVFSPDFPVIPAVGDQPAICRRDLARGPIGYWPSADSCTARDAAARCTCQ